MNNSTINKLEIEKFTELAEDWWNPHGKFKPLHKFNPIRIKYIKDFLIKHFKIKNKSNPLNNIEILDIGCGGGLLSEPLYRLGGNITGIDASRKNIKIAKLHSKKNNLKINYFCDSPESFKKKKKFDVVLNMEIIEHVDDLNLFLKTCSKFLKEDGIMFIATLNKTFKSYIFAIIGAEYILRWLPIGTHDWEKFVEPKKLSELCRENSLKFLETSGIKFNPLTDKWNLSDDSSVNYLSTFRKV